MSVADWSDERRAVRRRRLEADRRPMGDAETGNSPTNERAANVSIVRPGFSSGFPRLRRFYRVLPTFHRIEMFSWLFQMIFPIFVVFFFAIFCFYLVASSLNRLLLELIGFSWVFTGFYLVLLGLHCFNGLYSYLSRISSALLGFIKVPGLYFGLPSFQG